MRASVDYLTGEDDTLVYYLKDGGGYKMEPLDETSIAEEEMTDFVNLYPNPTSNRLTVEYSFQSAGEVNLKLYNLMGKLQRSQILEQQHSEIDVSDLVNGVYIVVVEVDGILRKQSKLVLMK